MLPYEALALLENMLLFSTFSFPEVWATSSATEICLPVFCCSLPVSFREKLASEPALSVKEIGPTFTLSFPPLSFSPAALSTIPFSTYALPVFVTCRSNSNFSVSSKLCGSLDSKLIALTLGYLPLFITTLPSCS